MGRETGLGGWEGRDHEFNFVHVEMPGQHVTGDVWSLEEMSGLELKI